MTSQRMGMVIGVKWDKLAEHKRLHAEPWPERDAALSAANILREPKSLLFDYGEYVGGGVDAITRDYRRARQGPIRGLGCRHGAACRVRSSSLGPS